MRQRLGLAQALIGEPQVLLLDEPTTGLDPALRLNFYEIVQALRDRGATVVLSSHALAELGEHADRVVIMSHGTMVAHGSIDELRRIARLPAKIRLTISDSPENVRNWLGTGEKWRQVNGHMVEIEAPPERKIELLRRATDVDAPVNDVDVMQPTLDELYAHFLRTQEAAR
jgi:Cu-processing system ATP-binding protein